MGPHISMKMSLLQLVVALVGLVTLDTASDVVVGTEKNFDALINTNTHVLAEFYAPWCGHCKNLEPEYEKAAASLKGISTLKLVKIDATVERKLGEQFGVQGFPTLKWFVGGKAQEYSGGRDHDTIVSWVKKKTGPASVKLGDKASVDAWSGKVDAAILFLGKESEAEYKEYEKAAQLVGSIPAGHSEDEDLIQLYTPAKVVMITKFEDSLVKYDGEMTATAISEFAVANSLPLVVQFTQETQDKIFGEDAPKRHLLGMHMEGFTDKANLDRELAAVGKEYKGKALVISVEKTMENEGVFNFFGISDVSVPQLVAIDQTKGGMKKYFYDGELEHTAIKAWMADVIAGKLAPKLKSEKEPAENNGPVKVLVGTTYEAEVKSGKDVMVEFYAPWCGHCKALEPEYNALGTAFKDIDSVVIAKIDATANELESPNVEGFPTLYFYKSGAEATKYEGGRTAKEMEEYIRKNAGSPIKAKHDKEL